MFAGLWCIFVATGYMQVAVICFNIMLINVLFQVVELLNQAALISTDEKLTVLKQVCSLLKSVTEISF